MTVTSRGSLLPVPAAPRRVNLEHIPRRHLRRPDVPQLLRAAIPSHHAIDPHLPRLPARHAERWHLASIRQNAGRHLLQEAHAPHAATAAVPAPCPTRALPDLIALQPHWEAELEHFGIRQP